MLRRRLEKLRARRKQAPKEARRHWQIARTTPVSLPSTAKCLSKPPALLVMPSRPIQVRKLAQTLSSADEVGSGSLQTSQAVVSSNCLVAAL